MFSAFKRVVSTFLTVLFAALGILLVALALLARTDDAGVTRIADRPVMTILSDSMTPKFKAGDLIIESPVADRADELAVGTVITFQANNGLVTHRIVQVENTDTGVSYRTQGDANNVIDQTPVKPEDIVGVYSWRIPSAGYVLDAVRTPVGMALVIFVPALLLLIPTLAKMWRAAGDEETDPKLQTDDDSSPASEPVEPVGASHD